MAIAFTNITSGSTAASQTSFTTGSISPSPDQPIYVAVESMTQISANPNTPTISGNGVTWVLINFVNFDSATVGRRRVSVFRGIGSPVVPGVITIDFAGQTQTNCLWIVDQTTGANFTGSSGSGATPQSAFNSDESGSVTSLTATLQPFSNPNNGTYGACVTAGNEVFTVGSGFTQLANVLASTNDNQLQTQWKSTPDTTVDFSISGGGDNIGIIGVEIAVPRNLGFIRNNLRPHAFSPGIAR